MTSSPVDGSCQGLSLSRLEDFGITPVQANAAGGSDRICRGRALDTVVPGVTGEHFTEQTVDALAAALSAFNPSGYDANTSALRVSL